MACALPQGTSCHQYANHANEGDDGCAALTLKARSATNKCSKDSGGVVNAPPIFPPIPENVQKLARAIQ